MTLRSKPRSKLYITFIKSQMTDLQPSVVQIMPIDSDFVEPEFNSPPPPEKPKQAASPKNKFESLQFSPYYASKSYWLWELASLGIVLSIMVVSLLLTTRVQVITTRRAMTIDYTLIDVGHNILPHYAQILADYVILIPIFIWAIFLLAVGAIPHLVTFVRRMLLVWSVGMLVRAVAIVLTQMPDPEHACLVAVNPEYLKGPAIVVLWNAHIMKRTVMCGDLIISGHTLFAVAACSAGLRSVFSVTRTANNPNRAYDRQTGSFSPFKVGFLRRWLRVWEKTPWWTPLVMGLAGLACCLGFIAVVIGSRLHYTVDVFFGILLASGLDLILELSVKNLRSQGYTKAAKYISYPVVGFASAEMDSALWPEVLLNNTSKGLGIALSSEVALL